MAQREAVVAKQAAEAVQQQAQAAQQLRCNLTDTDATRMLVAEELATKQVEWQKWRQSHSFALLKLNDAAARYPYYVIRCTRGSMNERVKLVRKKHPQALVIFLHMKVPNSINLY